MQSVDTAGQMYPAVRACIDLYEAGAWPAIQPAHPGRSFGTGRTLIDNRPEQLRMDFFLWRRAAMG